MSQGNHTSMFSTGAVIFLNSHWTVILKLPLEDPTASVTVAVYVPSLKRFTIEKMIVTTPVVSLRQVAATMACWLGVVTETVAGKAAPSTCPMIVTDLESMTVTTAGLNVNVNVDTLVSGQANKRKHTEVLPLECDASKN